MRDWGRMGKTSAQDDLPTPAPSAAGVLSTALMQ